MIISAAVFMKIYLNWRSFCCGNFLSFSKEIFSNDDLKLTSDLLLRFKGATTALILSKESEHRHILVKMRCRIGGARDESAAIGKIYFNKSLDFGSAVMDPPSLLTTRKRQR